MGELADRERQTHIQNALFGLGGVRHHILDNLTGANDQFLRELLMEHIALVTEDLHKAIR